MTQHSRLTQHARQLVAILTGIVCVTLWAPRPAPARTQLRNICTIYGQKETPVIGLGLVVGLSHTGDGGKNAAAMRALASTLRYLNNPIESGKELTDAANVAMVAISATIPKEGASNGQRVDCYVTSTFGAKSLKGGRLLISPIRMPNVNDLTVVGLASGPIVIEDAEVLTSGRVPNGIVLERDFRTQFIDMKHGNKVTLVIDAPHATFGVASHIVERINTELYPVLHLKPASALGPDRIEVAVPDLYRDDPVGFIAWLLDIDVMTPQTEARVWVNTKSKTVLIHGDVQISPVVISHKNLKVEVAGSPSDPAPFAPLGSGQENQQQLDDLLKGLQALKVSNEDVIAIVRELYRSGNLHGVYEEK
jgi:flagellar P-ring protein precursor FlgI